MNLPDQSHINHVRDLLWQRRGRGASIIVGAGFSRNATPISASAKEFPLWHEVAKQLCSKLYPISEQNRLNNALFEASSTSGFLRLAQEYEIAFGRNSLHNFIKEVIPDEDYLPSDSHAALLELPWKDVFTTNWDTLLERTRLTIPERSYSVVRTTEELTSASSPRIIKLHGSLPAQTPFIFTEEDYRAYPKKFAPFVNTVQQAMMESVVLLIGFSGDDPNFLQWSGWIRDNLGESAPKIYLAGWLDLSPHRRRMLEDRNVVPIDIARHPQAHHWLDHLRHQNATEWILKTLKEGNSYNFKNWPYLRDEKKYPSPIYLEPIEKNSQKLPIDEPRPTNDINVDHIKSIIKTWSHNRSIYPKWLFYPLNRTYSVERTLQTWESKILKKLHELSIIEQIQALRELVWWYQILLMPISEDINTKATLLLDQINFKSKSTGSLILDNPNWFELHISFIEIMLASLTAARLNLDKSKFFNILDKLKLYQDENTELKHNIIHEECLWLLNNLSYNDLEALLDNWNVSKTDPIWMFRKAALLVELNDEKEANKLINQGLGILRANPDKPNTFANASREGWALLLAQAFKEGYGSIKHDNSQTNSLDIWERWEQLSTVNCNARIQKNHLLDRITKNDGKDDINPPFDLYIERGETISFNSNNSNTYTYRAIRLCESAALPLSANNVTISSDLIKAALKELRTINIKLALRISIRLKPSDDDQLINPIYSRNNIATISIEDIYELSSQLINLLEYSTLKFRSGNNRSFWVSYIRACIEALSRIVIRFENKKLEQIFNQACIIYQDNNLNRDPWLNTPINNLLTRCWETAHHELKDKFTLALLNLPIAGVNSFLTSDQHIDSAACLNSYKIRNKLIRDQSKDQWPSIVSLIINGLNSNGQGRESAAARLCIITPYLKPEEYSMIAKSLWEKALQTNDSLPQGTNLYDFVFLSLPEPEKGIAEKNFRLKYFSDNIDINNYNILSEKLDAVALAICWHQNEGTELLLSEQEQEHLAVVITKWLNHPKTNPFYEEDPISTFRHAFNNSCLRIESTLSKIHFILPKISISGFFTIETLLKIVALFPARIYSYATLVSLAQFLPNQIEAIQIYLRKGLISEYPKEASNAMYSLYIWLETSLKTKNSQIPKPSDDLFREIGLTIATRRKGSLIQALIAANAIFEFGTEYEYGIIESLVLDGLWYLKIEQKYDLEHPDPQEVPLIRRHCVKLAYTMSKKGLEQNQTIIDWLEISKSDPLPEVRYAIESES